MKGSFALKHGKAFTWLLTTISMAGTAGTGILAATATPKALKAIKDDEREHGIPGHYTKWEAVKACWKCYIPAGLACISTMVCTAGIGIMSAKTQKSIAASYALLDQAYRNYRKHVKDVLGKEITDKIEAEEAIKKFHENPPERPDYGEELFYDEYSERYFSAKLIDVLNAEYELNRLFRLRGYVTLNDFYAFLDLPKTVLGENLGWSEYAGAITYGYEWIDFEHSEVKMDDGLECYILHLPFPPTEDYMDPD